MSNWIDRAFELKKNVSWPDLPLKLETEFGQRFTFNQVRNAMRRDSRYKPANPQAGDKSIRFALCGDNQCNSKWTQITHLHNFYDICLAEGITAVYHTGDIDEGEQMRAGHQYECYAQGADDHVANIVRTYPQRHNMRTYFITGNHDHSIIKRAGYDIGKPISEQRKDMKYLGQSCAVVELSPFCTMELRHPIDGTSYAISHKIQRMVDAMSDNDKPSILAVGHYHKSEYIPYQYVHCFQTGCFQGQTSWMKGKNIQASVGGWIVELRINDEGEVTRCTQSFFPYPKAIKNDYLNWQ